MDQQSGLFIALPFIVLILAWRMWRGSRARKLTVERMWIRPAIILVILGLSVASQPPPMNILTLLALAIATAIGVGFGWWRGKTVRVSINSETHELTSQQSPWGMLIFIAIMAVRVGARYALRGAHDFQGVPVTAIVDGLTLFYGGQIVGMQLEVYLRASRLLKGAIAAKAAGKAVPTQVSEEHS